VLAARVKCYEGVTNALRGSGLAGDVADFLGREHQARGRDRPQARLAALTKASVDSRSVIAGQGAGERSRSGHYEGYAAVGAAAGGK
jgi:hypothetical protein